jgi:MFS family permease
MLTFIGVMFLQKVLGHSPVEASWIIVITTGTCMVLEPPAGRLVDKIGPGIPIAVSLFMQAIALAWMGFFTPDTTLLGMVVPLALMGAGVGIALPACNTGGMSAVDAERAGMGSGLMQMTFNIPAALGVALVTSVIGTATLSHVANDVQGSGAEHQAQAYVDGVIGGSPHAADELSGLPDHIRSMIETATTNAQASSITMSMFALAVVALAGGIMALLVIGRRRTPDHLEMTHAAEV